ncbi:MAG: DNA translocase FtsK [Thermogutta sp.]|nr:DNA translocase FtsK [Thermogutta sp.]
MSVQSELRRDLLSLFSLALALFLIASLATFDPADPPSRAVYPGNENPSNVCGWAGAVTAHLLLEWTGIGAAYATISAVALTVALLFRVPLGRPGIRIAGWFFSLLGLTAAADILITSWSPGVAVGPGGYLGALTALILRQYAGTAGSLLIAVVSFVAGVLVASNADLRGFTRILFWPLHGLAQGVMLVAGAYGLPIPAPERSPLDAKRGGEGRRDKATSRIADGRARQADGEGGGETVRVIKPGTDSQPVENPSPAPNPPPPPAPSRREDVRIRKPQKPSRESLLEEIESVAHAAPQIDYKLPSLDLLLESEPFRFEAQEQDVRRKAAILEKTFADFGYRVRVVEIQTGPVIAQFEVELEAGLRLSKITVLADDLAIALRVPSVRIVAPIPGKNTVGIEVPNSERQLVRLREVIEESHAKFSAMRIPIFLGKDVAGTPLVVDLSTMPHLLIAGRTGTGKSVCLNSIIMSILMTRTPEDVRLLLIDPKMVELSPYKRIPHLMHPVVTDMRKAEAILAWAVEKMEERYGLLARAGVRHLSVYNQLGEEELMERMRPESEEDRARIPTHMPYIVIVADEMADLMMTSAKEVETHIIRLAQKSRAVGIHLVLATQKPTVDVITGLIKSNLPARICFEVASRVDSRVVLDEMGAEKLLGNGDMLFLRPGTSTLIRGQGTYVSDDEINRVIDAVAVREPQFVQELVQLKPSSPGGTASPTEVRDELYEAAVDIVIREGRGSVSLLQRALGIGYGRAARLIDYMAEDGIVGPYNGSQAREVLISLEEWEARGGEIPRPAQGGSHATSDTPSGGSTSPVALPRSDNRIVLVSPGDQSDPARSAGPSARILNPEMPALSGTEGRQLDAKPQAVRRPFAGPEPPVHRDPLSRNEDKNALAPWEEQPTPHRRAEGA